MVLRTPCLMDSNQIVWCITYIWDSASVLRLPYRGVSCTQCSWWASTVRSCRFPSNWALQLLRPANFSTSAKHKGTLDTLQFEFESQNCWLHWNTPHGHKVLMYCVLCWIWDISIHQVNSKGCKFKGSAVWPKMTGHDGKLRTPS